MKLYIVLTYEGRLVRFNGQRAVFLTLKEAKEFKKSLLDGGCSRGFVGIEKVELKEKM